MLTVEGTPLVPQSAVTNWSEAALVGDAIKNPRQAASPVEYARIRCGQTEREIFHRASTKPARPVK